MLSNVVVAAACGDGGVRAPVTIVVDTDGARAKEDASRLREIQKGVQDDRAQLEKAREELAAARKSLETASTTEQKASLSQKVQELESRLHAEAAGNVVTKDELDAQLRAQEERLKAFISAEVHGSAPAPTSTSTTTPPTTTTTTNSAPTAQQARFLVSEGKARLQGMAVEVADVDGAVALVAAVEAAAAKGDAAAAVANARAFADKAAAVVVDKGFCRRKYDRVNTLVKAKALAPDVASRVAGHLSTAMAKTGSGEFVAANAALNDAISAAR